MQERKFCDGQEARQRLRIDKRLSPWNGLGPNHVSLQKFNDMSQVKVNSYACTPGPPAGSMRAVQRNRDESDLPTSKLKTDEGRFRRPDCAPLK